MNEKDVVLEARGVEKSYRDDATAVPVLRGVNLAVHRGETVASSSELRVGEVHPFARARRTRVRSTAGEVTVAGESMTGLSSNVRGRLRNAHLVRVPVSSSSSRIHRARQRGDAALDSPPPEGGGEGARPKASRRRRAFRTARITCLRSSRAASGSASPSPARS